MRVTWLLAVLSLALSVPSAAMSYIQDAWLDPNTNEIRAMASTSADPGEEFVSASITIQGSDGVSDYRSECDFYSISAHGFLSVYNNERWDIISEHWSEIATTVMQVFGFDRRRHMINYGFPQRSGNTCTYNKDCPNGKGRCGTLPTEMQLGIPGAPPDCTPYVHLSVWAWRYREGSWNCTTITDSRDWANSPIACQNPEDIN